MKKQRISIYFIAFAMLILIGRLLIIEAKADDFADLYVDYEKTIDSDSSDLFKFTLTNKGEFSIFQKADNSQIFKCNNVLDRVWFNDEYAYFLQRGSDKRLNLTAVSTEGTMPRTIKTFNKKLKESYDLQIAYVKGDYIYYLETNFKAFLSDSTYYLKRVNIKTDKTETLATECGAIRFGKNRILYFEPSNDPSPMTLHSITYSGKKHKMIDNVELHLSLKDKKIYLAIYNFDNKYTIYKYNEDFTDAKKLSRDFDAALIYKIDDNAVYYSKDMEYNAKGYYKLKYGNSREQYVKGNYLSLFD